MDFFDPMMKTLNEAWKTMSHFMENTNLDDFTEIMEFDGEYNFITDVNIDEENEFIGTEEGYVLHVEITLTNGFEITNPEGFNKFVDANGGLKQAIYKHEVEYSGADGFDEVLKNYPKNNKWIPEEADTFKILDIKIDGNKVYVKWKITLEREGNYPEIDYY